MRKLYVLPPHWETRTMQEAMEWATDEVLRLDAEVTELKLQLSQAEAELESLRTRRIQTQEEVRA